MARSMSGHGRGEAANERIRIVVEVRSVNHRFCRVSVRMPSELASFEDEARRRTQARVLRGKVDLAVQVESAAGGQVRVDRELLAAYGRELSAAAGSAGLAPPTLADVLSIPGVLITDGVGGIDPEADLPLLSEAVDRALEALDSMRVREGEHLAQDLRERLALIASGCEQVESAAKDLPQRTRDALRDKIEAMLADVGRGVDEDRLIQEAAYQAERADVTEELVRLRSHLTKAAELLAGEESVGRTLEFLTQEMHREINTIGSKTKELEIAELGVSLKSELEKIREQVQNLE